MNKTKHEYFRKELIKLLGISRDKWNRLVYDGLLPLGHREPPDGKGGLRKLYPSDTIKQILTILELEERGCPRKSMIAILFVLGYSVDWDKLKSNFLQYLDKTEKAINIQISKGNEELQDSLKDEFEKASRYPSRGKPTKEKQREQKRTIERQIVLAIGFTTVLPALLGEYLLPLPQKAASHLDKDFLTIREELSNLEGKEWITLDYWRRIISSTTDETWIKIQSVLKTFTDEILKPMIDSNNISESLKNFFTIPNVVPFYVIPLVQPEVLKTIEQLVCNKETLFEYKKTLNLK